MRCQACFLQVKEKRQPLRKAGGRSASCARKEDSVIFYIPDKLQRELRPGFMCNSPGFEYNVRADLNSSLQCEGSRDRNLGGGFAHNEIRRNLDHGCGSFANQLTQQNARTCVTHVMERLTDRG